MSRAIPPSLPKTHAAAEHVSLVDETLFAAQKKVWNVEVTVAVLLFLTGALAFFLLVVLLDHWVMPGGLGIFGRVLLWLGFFAGTAIYVRRRVLPLLKSRVHPYYAAAVVEENLPGIKNALLNLVFLRRELAPLTAAEREDPQQVMNQRVLLSLERQTAGRVRNVELGATVDHAAVLHTGYVFAAVFLLCFFYFILSPKSSFASLGRMFFPWANIPAPTRVVFLEITPGDATIFQGETLPVSVRMKHLRDAEPVTLYFSTQDGQVRDVAVMMQPATEETESGRGGNGTKNAFHAVLGGTDGIQQTLTWRISAGDCVSQTFRVYVKPPLSITPEKIVLIPPAYTDIPPSEQKMGDIKAPDGTRVRLTACANQPVRQAQLVFHSADAQKPEEILLMKPVSGSSGNAAQPSTPEPERCTRVEAEFTLRMSPQQPLMPEFAAYEIRFQTPDGAWSGNAVRHWIQVTPDVPPVVTLLDAPEDGAVFPVNGKMTLHIRAEDTDYALRGVAFYASWNGRLLKIPPILNIPLDRPGMKTPFQTVWQWSPAAYHLKPGDEILWWVEVADNRQPAANRARTESRILKIAAPGNETAGPAPALTPDKNEGEEAKNPAAVGRTPDADGGENPPGMEHSAGPGRNGTPEPQEKMRGPESPETQPQGSPGDGGENTRPEPGAEAAHTLLGSGEAEAGENTGREADDGEESGAGAREGRKGGKGETAELSENESGESGELGENSGENPANSKNHGGHSDKNKPPLAPEGYDPLAPRKSGEDAGSGKDTDAGKPPEEGSAENSGENPGENTQADGAGQKPKNDAGGTGDPQTGEGNAERNPGGNQKKNGNGRRQGEPGSAGNAADEMPEKAGEKNTGGSGGDSGAQENQTGTGEKQDSGSSENSRGGESRKTGRSGDSGNSETPESESAGPGDSPSDAAGGKERNSPGQETSGGKGTRPESMPDAVPTKVDSSTDPGAAFEEILRHRSQAEAGGKQENPGNPQQPEPGGEMPPDAELQDAENPASPSAEGNEHQGTREDGKSSDRDGKDSTNSGQDMKARDQRGADNSAESEPQAAGNKNKGGNRSGGSENSDRQGLGRDGSNTPNEEGAPQGSGGQGPTGAKGGQGTLSDEPTGVSDPQQRAGDGSQTKPNKAGEYSGSSQQSPDKPTTGAAPPPDTSAAPETSPDQKKGNRPSGGTGMGMRHEGDAGRTPPSAEEVAAADAANLEYAKKQTILALEHLRHEIQEEDSDLLRNLGWSREEAAAFLKKWNAMHRSAEKTGTRGDESRETLSRSLRNLGLTPASATFSAGTYTETKRPDVRGALRVPPPDAWAEQADAYSKSVAAGVTK